MGRKKKQGWAQGKKKKNNNLKCNIFHPETTISFSGPFKAFEALRKVKKKNNGNQVKT